jgi:type IV pilus assembly protein PilA
MDPMFLARLRAHGGFSLIELLVLVLIVGVLAGLAIPLFVMQRAKGQDASAKSDARNVAGVVEACYTNTDDYGACTDPADLQDTGTSFGSSAGDAEVSATATREYTVTAHSHSGTDFKLSRDASGQHRTCSHPGRGACGDDGNW